MAQSTETEISSVRISSTTGSVSVVATPGLAAVESHRRPMQLDGPVATVESTHQRAVVAVPEGMDLVIGTTTGRVEVRGVVGRVAVTTKTGKVEIEDASSVDVRTVTGRVSIERSRSDALVFSRTGRVEIGRTGSANVTTTTGRIVLSEVAGPAVAHCASGRIEITMAEAHDVEADTVSGRITISLPAGVRPRIDTPSAGSIPVSGDHDCVVTARSGSGRVDVSTR